MAYIINKFSGAELLVLDDGTVDTTTSLKLVGRNYVGYGEIQNENFVYLLENFADENPPKSPIVGQTWFDTDVNRLNVWNGSVWSAVGTSIISETAPLDPVDGTLWLRSTDNSLQVWLGTSWSLIGPESVPGYGKTKAESTTLLDGNSNIKPVIKITVNGFVIAICSEESFDINSSTAVVGFNSLVAGINLANTFVVSGNLNGVAQQAQTLATTRKINGVSFNGSNDITIKASTTHKLIKGSYLTGSDFDGSFANTWAVDATSANVMGKVVARNASGGFSAGTITANFVGDLIGNVNATEGTSTFRRIVVTDEIVGGYLASTSLSARQLETARTINGVSFNGTGNITVPAAANTLTGSVLASNITQSALTEVGTLTSLTVAGSVTATGFIGSGNNLTNLPAGNIVGSVANATRAAAADLADLATLSTRASNIAGGSLGSLPYQSSPNTTTFLPVGTVGQVLTVAGGDMLAWTSIGNKTVQSISAGVPSNATGNNGDIIYQY
jgi:hypothetical protein